MLWCFADYHPSLCDKPPCNQSLHERFFGLVRADGYLKPHAKVIRNFAETKPTVQKAEKIVSVETIRGEYYNHPLEYAKELYQKFV